MSGTSSASVVTVAGVGGVVGEGPAGGGCYYRPPFTAVQWQELEHQAMIYKYIIAGLPVPPELVVPIRRSFEALSSRFFHRPSLGYCSYYGKKFDPEPGRCRRTDGKKWRCSKDAYPDSKYCERHMHRGRNRSRKPVESHSASQSMSTAMSHMATGSSSSSGIYQNSGSGSFQSIPFSVGNSDDLYSGSNVTKLQIEPTSYGGDNKDYRYIHGLTPDADQHSFSPEASGSVGNIGIGSNVGNTWRLLPSQVPSGPLMKSKNDSQSQLLSHSSDLHMAHAYDPMMNANMSKHRQQHCFFGNEINSPGPIKQEQEQQQQQSMRHFFDEWPTTKESWSNLDEGGGPNKNAFSTTQLSISIPMTRSEFSSRDSRSSDDA